MMMGTHTHSSTNYFLLSRTSIESQSERYEMLESRRSVIRASSSHVTCQKVQKDSTRNATKQFIKHYYPSTSPNSTRDTSLVPLLLILQSGDISNTSVGIKKCHGVSASQSTFTLV